MGCINSKSNKINLCDNCNKEIKNDLFIDEHFNIFCTKRCKETFSNKIIANYI